MSFAVIGFLKGTNVRKRLMPFYSIFNLLYNHTFDDTSLSSS